MRVKPEDMNRESLISVIKDVAIILDEEDDDLDEDEVNLGKFHRIMRLFNKRVDS